MNGNPNVLTWSGPVKQGPFNLHPLKVLLQVATPSSLPELPPQITAL